ncbi:MAG: trypsin-like peptidase domain-containing protein [Oscillospiraceae bacterium]|nr:trypsin-like peptidase domain-containing protein [Oscillospiraceae bacterium]
MNKQNHYNPKYSKEEDNWQDSVWQTGSTQPPKNRGGLIALMLILIIFLCGIITVLGILNIKLFQKLQIEQQDNNLSISFTVGETEAEALMISETAPETTAVAETDPVSIDIDDSAPGTENIPMEGAKSLQDIYTENIPSVVSIKNVQSNGSISGTGVIFSREGYIITNAHVVENCISISVQLTDDRVFPAKVIGADEVTDLAVLYIDADNLVPAKFGNSDSLRVGDTVVAIGDPLGIEFRGTYTNGIVSAINRDVSVNGRSMTLIQTNAALNSGNSGGPLINCYGQVIGINTMKIGAFTNRAGVEGLGFAIPISTVKTVVDQLISQGYVSGRPDLCIAGDTLSTFYQYYYRLPAGLYVTDVANGSDAYHKGMEPGDILISLDDRSITSMDDLRSFLYSCEVGQSVKAVIYRDGKQYQLTLVLSENKG